MSNTHMITAFAGVFEQRLNTLKRTIKKEYESTKNEQRKTRLKKLIKEAKEMRDLVRELKPKCPHCGGKL